MRGLHRSLTAAGFFAALSLLAAGEALAQAYSPSLYQAMEWRNIGPHRGGRVMAVEGVPSEPRTFYMGATGGGVWKTVDGGVEWKNISDKFFNTGSVGDIAVSLSDPNVIYVGMGESAVRGLTMAHGDGVYKSTDAGKTWTHLGLEKTRHISRVIIHPDNPDIVYVAAQGSPWGYNPERGVYRSMDGGKTWRLILHTDEKTGVSDMQMDPNNPRILYAGMWQHIRKPWHGYQITSGGPGSALMKSTDGGETWTRLTKGLPEPAGKFGVAVSPADNNRVYLLVEAKQGKSGLYRSDDQGESWRHINPAHVLSMRSDYYLRVVADPLDRETIYVLNAPFLKSIDGGKTFESRPVPHGDNHDMWIHPKNSNWMVQSNDGGANVSYDGGESWSTQNNQPTAQFYRINADNLFPYSLYGAQQDNTTLKIKSRSFGPGIGDKDWYEVGGGENGHVVFDRNNPRLIYSGNYQGQITEFDDDTGLMRDIRRYPLGTAYRPGDQYPFRYNWNAPIVVSQHDPSVIYHGAQMVLKSTDRGQSWTEISEDLTRDDPSKQGVIEGEFVVEGVAGEMYNTIFYIAESPHQKGELWVGTDDGFIYLTRDEGGKWENVTPAGIGEQQINMIELSPHTPGTAYAVVTGYKFNNFRPQIVVTSNYGRSWRSITRGIAADDWARVVREDTEREGLLYAGTETSAYVSFNGGADWQTLQLNLPRVPITDMKVHGDDLLAATQGRAFWILDDLEPLREMGREAAGAKAHLFTPSPEKLLIGGGRLGRTDSMGRNPQNGTVIFYTLAAKRSVDAAPIILEILDQSGAVVNRFGDGQRSLPCEAGMNRFVWDWRRTPLPAYENLRQWPGAHTYRVAPGTYTARLTVDDAVLTKTFVVEQDPRIVATPQEQQEKQAVLAGIAADARAVSDAVATLGLVRERARTVMAMAKDASLAAAGDALNAAIDAWLNDVIEEDDKHFIDAQHSTTRLDFSVLEILRIVDGATPPLAQGMRERLADVEERWTARRADYEAIVAGPLAAFNSLATARNLSAIPAETPPAPSPPAVSGGRGDDDLAEEELEER